MTSLNDRLTEGVYRVGADRELLRDAADRILALEAKCALLSASLTKAEAEAERMWRSLHKAHGVMRARGWHLAAAADGRDVGAAIAAQAAQEVYDEIDAILRGEG